MRYWVYINDKVDGPFDEMKLADVAGFTPDTLICAEEADGGNQEWVKASSIFEFDEATKTMTRTNMTEEDYKKLTGQSEPEPVQEEQSQTQTGAIDNAATQILIDKIDHLTREIEGMRGKLDEALAAAAAAQAEMTKHNLALAAAAAQKAEEEKANTQTQPTETADKPSAEESVTEDALITNTASLVNHAEQLVAKASDENTEKPIDFLDEIQIQEPKEENLADRGGEEEVLRSALDSLYGADKIQTEEEKESTFQDLLSPLKTAAVATAAVGTAAVVAASLSGDNKEEQPAEAQEQPVAEEPTAQEPAVTEEPTAEEPTAQEPSVAEEPTAEEPAVEPTSEPAPEQITEEQREELINEITAPAQQNDFILQAIEEAQQEENVADQQEPVQEDPVLDLQEIAPAETQEAEQDLPQEKGSLDLSDTPQLSIINEDQPEPVKEEPVLPVQEQGGEIDASLTPMGPEEAEDALKEITETVKELVPGKKLEDTQSGGDGILSQADLEEAFTERSPLQEDFPLPEEAPAQEQEPTALPEGQGFYTTAGDMTEVELKEGSTYLISDFIPPAQTKADEDSAQNQVAEGTLMEELAPAGAAAVGAAAVAATVAAAIPDAITKNESVQEITPVKDEADLTMSKVILENTIKTKRGATMDIKTVPMVQEPADTQRLDLSDSELDINAQHDLKAADIKPAGNGVTKVVLGTLVALVIVAIIYVMLAYLEILPAQFNVLKKGPTAAQLQAEQAQLDEMLGTNVEQVPQDPFAAAQPMQLPDNVENQLDPQTVAPADPLDPVLTEVKNYTLANGQTLQQLITAKHPATQDMIEWSITTAVEPQNYSVLVKVPPENPQSFKISYRFNYNALTKALDPTISDSKNLLDSVTVAQ